MSEIYIKVTKRPLKGIQKGNSIMCHWKERCGIKNCQFSLFH